MGLQIDMSNFKMIYNDQVFNVVGIMPTFGKELEGGNKTRAKFIEACAVDENGELIFIKDEAWMFKFVRR